MIGIDARRSVETLDGGSFLVIVPSFDHEKRDRIRAVVVAMVEIQSLVEGLAASIIYVAIESPLGRGVVEAGPHASDHDFVGMLVLHRAVEVVEIALTPVAAVRGPSPLTGLHPGIRAGKVIAKLRRRLVFVD